MVQTQVFPEERGEVYQMTVMFCMPGGPKLLGGLKKKNQKLDKMMSICFIYIFSSLSFVLSFYFVQTGASQKDVYKTMEKTLVIFSLPDLIVSIFGLGSICLFCLFIYLFIFKTQTFVFWLTPQYGDQAASSAFPPSLSKVTL